MYGGLYSCTTVKSLTKKTIELNTTEVAQMENPDTPCRPATHRLRSDDNLRNFAYLPEIQREKCYFDLTCAKKRSLTGKEAQRQREKRRSDRKLKLNNSQLRSRPSHRDANVEGVLP